jgi:hypothetical protein
VPLPLGTKLRTCGVHPGNTANRVHHCCLLLMAAFGASSHQTNKNSIWNYICISVCSINFGTEIDYTGSSSNNPWQCQIANMPGRAQLPRCEMAICSNRSMDWRPSIVDYACICNFVTTYSWTKKQSQEPAGLPATVRATVRHQHPRHEYTPAR